MIEKCAVKHITCDDVQNYCTKLWRCLHNKMSSSICFKQTSTETLDQTMKTDTDTDTQLLLFTKNENMKIEDNKHEMLTTALPDNKENLILDVEVNNVTTEMRIHDVE